MSKWLSVVLFSFFLMLVTSVNGHEMAVELLGYRIQLDHVPDAGSGVMLTELKIIPLPDQK